MCHFLISNPFDSTKYQPFNSRINTNKNNNRSNKTKQLLPKSKNILKPPALFHPAPVPTSSLDSDHSAKAAGAINRAWPRAEGRAAWAEAGAGERVGANGSRKSSFLKKSSLVFSETLAAVSPERCGLMLSKAIENEAQESTKEISLEPFQRIVRICSNYTQLQHVFRHSDALASNRANLNIFGS